jgi:hypothetical protein
MSTYHFRKDFMEYKFILAIAVLIVALVFARRVACMSSEAFNCMMSDSYAFLVYKREVPFEAPERAEP